MKHYRPDPKNPVHLTPEQLKRLDETPIDYSDIPELDDDFFRRAIMERDLRKKQLTIRLDSDVLDWFKAHGRGYQTRINRILRVVMESQPPAPTSKPRSASLSKQPSARPSKRRSAPRVKRSARAAK